MAESLQQQIKDLMETVDRLEERLDKRISDVEVYVGMADADVEDVMEDDEKVPCDKEDEEPKDPNADSKKGGA